MNAPATSFEAALDAAGQFVRAGEERSAALLLHTVAAEDRAWLLAQLHEDDRARLQGLVDELRTIGIPPAPELLQELAPGKAAPRAEHPAVASGLRHADADALASVLSAEPAELIARVIALGPWPWTGALLARLGAMHRQEVMERMAALPKEPGRVPCAFDLRLLELVEARLTQASPVRPATTAAARSGNGHWLSRWLGFARPAAGATAERLA